MCLRHICRASILHQECIAVSCTVRTSAARRCLRTGGRCRRRCSCAGHKLLHEQFSGASGIPTSYPGLHPRQPKSTATNRPSDYFSCGPSAVPDLDALCISRILVGWLRNPGRTRHSTYIVLDTTGFGIPQGGNLGMWFGPLVSFCLLSVVGLSA